MLVATVHAQVATGIIIIMQQVLPINDCHPFSLLYTGIQGLQLLSMTVTEITSSARKVKYHSTPMYDECSKLLGSLK